MNYIYVGRPSDLNVGNGKTCSAVGAIINSYLENPKKTIFSNIKLKQVYYQEITPKNLDDVLETKNAIVLLDELHAIIHKNHRITETCSKHESTGLCYKLSEFYRQVRKRGIDTYSTCQTFDDAHFQLRQLMNMQILCEKYHLDSGNKLIKCKPSITDGDRCDIDHRHFIKQRYYPTSISDSPVFFDPEPYYDFYDSYEIVKGWVTYD